MSPPRTERRQEPRAAETAARACLERWWPDQAAGGAALALALYALEYGGEPALYGVGLANYVAEWVMVLWFTLLAVAGLVLITFSALDKPRCCAAALVTIAGCLGANAVGTVGNDAAVGAAIAYTIAAIYTIKRAQDALQTHFEREHATRIARQVIERPSAHHGMG